MTHLMGQLSVLGGVVLFGVGFYRYLTGWIPIRWVFWGVILLVVGWMLIKKGRRLEKEGKEPLQTAERQVIGTEDRDEKYLGLDDD